MRIAIIAALAAAALLPLQSSASPSAEDFELRTTEKLVDLCAVPDGDPMVEAARGFCYGYLTGAGNYHRALKQGKDSQPLFCLPEPKMTRADAARLFVSWGRANPRHLKEAPIDGLIRFAVTTWPCK